MGDLIQNIIVIGLAGLCLVLVLRTVIRSLQPSDKKRGVCGGCVACRGESTSADAKTSRPSAERVVFIPAESLGKKSRGNPPGR